MADVTGRADGVVISALSKSFGFGRSRVAALDDVSLEVPSGAFVTLIGPSGCGKSTLLRIAAGLELADRGSITLFGAGVAQAKAEKQIGFVPQSPALLPWRSVLENVQLPQEINRRPGEQLRDPAELCRAVGLGDALDRRPGQLSGGMQQRVAVARAFALDHSLLLMDEPFAALDELTRERIRTLLLDLWSSDEKTVLFVTHSVPEAVILSDIVVVMTGRPGRIGAVLPVDLPRPRDDQIEFSDEFRSIERRVRDALRAGWSGDE